MKYILIIMSFLLLVGSVRAQKTTQVTENYYTRATAWGVGTFLFLSGRGVSSRGISFFSQKLSFHGTSNYYFAAPPQWGIKTI